MFFYCSAKEGKTRKLDLGFFSNPDRSYSMCQNRGLIKVPDNAIKFTSSNYLNTFVLITTSGNVSETPEPATERKTKDYQGNDWKQLIYSKSKSTVLLQVNQWKNLTLFAR